MFKTNFSGQKNLEGHKNWVPLPPNDPRGYGPVLSG